MEIVDPEDNMPKFLDRILESKVNENEVPEVLEESNHKTKDEKSIDLFKIRQLEQKQELLVGLTNLLFKKFEEIHPTKKFSKFEFTDLSWYKKLGSNQ
jgi:hypothetical protein